jgi:hypothetical protein
MNRLIMAAVVGLMIASALSTSASALTCVARSPNGARGAAQGVLLFPGRARAIALRRCILNGGNLGGAFCHIVACA